MQYVSFSVQLIFLNLIISRPIHFPAIDNFILLYSWIRFHSGYITYFLYPFVGWWAHTHIYICVCVFANSKSQAFCWSSPLAIIIDLFLFFLPAVF
jgi:hypothetical protein